MADLGRVYYDVSNPAGYAGAATLKRYVRNTHKPSEVDKWLLSQDSYTLHKQRRVHFKRNRYNVDNIDDIWQADLIDMRSFSDENDNFNYLLTVIDLFSRYAWVRPLIRKTSNCIIEAFRSIFKERKPINLQTDKGSEFIARPVKKFFIENDINFFVTNNPDTKAALVERFNRTLKGRMFRFFTNTNSRRYIDVLADLVSGYNNCYHRTIKMSPIDVNPTNILNVWKTLNENNKPYVKENKFRINDTVRISRSKNIFEKGYVGNFTQELFKINKIIRRNPNVYELRDMGDEIIEGVFYGYELQKVIVDDNTVFKIDKILNERGKGNRREVFVSWIGYPEKFNSWLKASTVQKI